MDKFTTFWCNVSSGLRIPKIIEIGPRLTESYSKKNKKVAVFFETQCISGPGVSQSVGKQTELLWAVTLRAEIGGCVSR